MDKLPDIQFRGTLRPSQAEVVEIAQRQLEKGEHRLHIVAPPGSGKTVLGLYLWAHLVRRRAVVLSPNSAIQAQWAARVDLFEPNPAGALSVSTDARQIGHLTSLTYQSVTMPHRGTASQEARATGLWIDQLIESGQAQDTSEAMVWIDDLRRHNSDFYDDRLSAYRKKIRDADAIGGAAMETLHRSSRETLERLRDAGTGLIILDECHHLMGHWGRVLADAHDWFDEPIVVGLTATPPDEDGKNTEDVERYRQFFGPVDFEVPVPAVVKDGFLAPYQDLAYVVRPTAAELEYIANSDDRLRELIEELCSIRLPVEVEPEQLSTESKTATPEQHQREQPTVNLVEWVRDTLEHKRLATRALDDWATFERRDPQLAFSGRYFLRMRKVDLPEDVPELDDAALQDIDEIADCLVPVLDRFVRHFLLRSPREECQQLAKRTTGELRLFGFQITETGVRACASPVSRVLAYSHAKLDAATAILEGEWNELGERMRAVLVTDFERTSVTSPEIEHLLDDEAGGAIAAFKRLVEDPRTDQLDPVLVTGSSVLVDDDLLNRFLEASRDWLSTEGFDVKLTEESAETFHIINGRGKDWSPRVYVRMITELFQRGLTRCLVGTRGLLGEGWDANRVNVLIDLTTVTTSMSINQLRGRSMRLDPEDPAKLSDNWDVICIAPEFAAGLNDYRRFAKKHRSLFGITDDGAIEKGVAHVHPAFSSLKPEELEGSEHLINADMLRRISHRAQVRKAWRIGEPYHEEPVFATELKAPPAGGELPPFAGRRDPWSRSSLVRAIGEAVLGALQEARLIEGRHRIHVGERAGGYVRAFLEQAPASETRTFARALGEALGPIDRPRYVIPRLVDRKVATFWSQVLPEFLGRFFERRETETSMLHAVPDCLARNKGLVEIYERHWNARVSPGKAVFAHRDRGKQLIERARQRGQIPSERVFQKEVFL